MGRGTGGAESQGCHTHLHPPPPTIWLRLCLDPPKLMCELGNVVINRIYEARVEAMAVKKPGPTCSR